MLFRSCVYRQASLLNIDDKTTYGNDINKSSVGKVHHKDFLKSKQGQDLNACLSFLKTELSKEDIRQELMINGIRNLSNLDNYADLVVRTREELKRWINKVGNDKRKRQAGL